MQKYYNELEDYKYSINYAWPGYKTILYNINILGMDEVFLDIVGRTNIGDFTQMLKNIVDIGVAWQYGQYDFSFPEGTGSNINNDTALNFPFRRSILESGSDPWDRKDTYTYRVDTMLLGTYGQYENNYSNFNGYVFPYLVAITELEPNTMYSVCSYVTVKTQIGTTNDGSSTPIYKYDTYLFNPQTVTTRPDFDENDDKPLKWTQGSGWNLIDQNKIPGVISKIDYVFDVFNSMCGIEKTIPINIENSSEFAGSSSGGEITITPGTATGSSCKDVVMHELLHVAFDQPRGDYSTQEDKSTQFMEWATTIPNARWRWMAGHNYPMTSSFENESIRDLYKRAAACQVSIDIKEENAPEYYLINSDGKKGYGTKHGDTYDFGIMKHDVNEYAKSNIPLVHDEYEDDETGRPGWKYVKQRAGDGNTGGTNYDFTIPNDSADYGRNGVQREWTVNNYKFRVVISNKDFIYSASTTTDQN